MKTFQAKLHNPNPTEKEEEVVTPPEQDAPVAPEQTEKVEAPEQDKEETTTPPMD